MFALQMAPKEKKRKAPTKKDNKSEEEVMSEKRHNQIAFLDPEEKISELKEITRWIRESRINRAVTFSTPVYKSLIKAFWNTASVVQIDGTKAIQGRVNDLDVIVSPEILNAVLELQDNPDAPSSIPIMCTRGCLLRIKCVGDIFSTQINKGDLPLRYKFLLYVLIQCLSNRRAGYDMAGNDLVGLMVALVLNKPFSISKYIFANMKENMTRTGSRITGNKFWMYPRFLQMIMNVQHPNLPKADDDILKIEPMILQSLRIIKSLATKRYKESDPPRKLIGALGKPDYVAPANDKWRHDDSQSDNEEPELKKRMAEKFGPVVSDSSVSDSDDDEAGDGGNAGAGAVGISDAGASSAGAAGGTSAGNDEEDSESDDNPPEPGYEYYLDELGVKKVRKIRREVDDDDDEYVPSDTEAERSKRKETVIKRKKKARKYIGTRSVEQSDSQEPTQEAAMDPNLGFMATKASTMVPSPPRSTEPTPVATSTPEAPTATPQAPTHSITSYICATTSQPSAECKQSLFEQMQLDEKVDFLFSELQAAAGQITRQTDVIKGTRADMIKQQVEINTLNATVGRQAAEITRQQAEIDQLKAENANLKAADEIRERQPQQMYAADNTCGIVMNRMKESSSALQRLADALKERHDNMKQWYGSRNTTIVDGVKKINEGYELLRKRVNTLWNDRCKQQEVMKKKDDDPEDQGNPDPSAKSEQPPATSSTQLVVFKPAQLGSAQGTSSGTVEEVQPIESLPGTSSVPSTADLALQVVHPITGELLEEGEIILDLSYEQLLALNAMKEIDDAEIDKMPSEPETADTENIDEIVFEGESGKSTYVRADRTEFDPFDEEWMQENQEDINE
ncbi:hypothetical protein HanXRQr2_Chr05g0194591 [Helianthus annuus]|uniref:Uncharacterized protein n=1 Tax=Helianthus annuus TaxID=4232 RepID=A0A9K3IVZ0_HELAN|nr:hypothetical protein HanXRQr2_Chr05g0194591 [Helianthus annuus]